MNHSEKARLRDTCDAVVVRGGNPHHEMERMTEKLGLRGTYWFKCFDRHGNLKWEDVVENLVTTVGKNLALDTILAGSAYTVTGPFMGLTQGSPTPAAGDTMASHAGWVEAGNANAPTYTSPRKTCAWSAASGGSKALSAALSFAITGAGTVGGCFLVYGSGAVSTIDNTSGTLFSIGAFTGGNKTVANLDTVNVSYSCAA